MVSQTRMPVVICSPFRSSHPVLRMMYAEYRDEAIKHSLAQGWVPIAPHAYFPRYLDDNDEASREIGMTCSKSLIMEFRQLHVYDQLGITAGMAEEMAFAKLIGAAIRRPKLDGYEGVIDVVREILGVKP